MACQTPTTNHYPGTGGALQPRRRVLGIGRAIAILLCALMLATGCSTKVSFDTTVPATPTPVNELALPDPTPTATPEPTPIPTPSPTPLPPRGQLTVTDADAVGSLGDDLLSLVEAVRVANGQIEVSQLSAAEAAFIEGEPGPDMADTIQVGLDEGQDINVPDIEGWVVEVFGNDGDTIVGSGVTIAGTGSAAASHNVMLVGSSNLTVEGFTFRGVTQGIGIESAGRQIEGITIRNNTFVDTSVHDVILQNSTLAGGIVDATIENNTFQTTQFTTDFHQFITAQAGTAESGQSTEFTFTRGLTIANNTLTASPGTATRCVALSGGFADFAVAGNVNGAQLEDVSVVGNVMSGCSVGVQVAAAHVEQSDTTVTDSAIRRLNIQDNAFDTGETAIAIYGAYVQPAPPSFNYFTGVSASLNTNLVDTVTIAGNTMQSLTRGIQLTGAEFNVGGSGSAQFNTLSTFTFDGESLAEVTGPFCEIRVDVGASAFDNTVQTLCPTL